AVAIQPVRTADWPARLEAAPEFVAWLAAQSSFKATRGQVLSVPAAEGHPAHVLFGVGEGGDPTVYRVLPGKLPAGDYRVEDPGLAQDQIALNWALGAYRFDRYRKSDAEGWPRLAVDEGVDLTEAIDVAHACALARDMVNTP